jgi:hypothetical protein
MAPDATTAASVALDDDVIYFQYDSSTPLRFSALHNTSTKNCAKDKKSPCKD